MKYSIIALTGKPGKLTHAKMSKEVFKSDGGISNS
jgi:hypothetical protein